MFINFSNHPSKYWDTKQRNAALQYGKIVDIAFPNIDVNLMDEQLFARAKGCVNFILKQKPDAVLCQGEFVFAFLVVSGLLQQDILVLSAVTKRITNIRVLDDATQKTSVFQFERFRKYQTLEGCI